MVALDLGHVVNPMSVEQQVESAVVYGLTAALYGEITIQDGRVEQSNFHDYRMLRMAEMPQGRYRADAERRLLGRLRRAAGGRGGAGALQRDLRRDRQAHPLVAAEEPRSEKSLTAAPLAAIGRQMEEEVTMRNIRLIGSRRHC